jgi:cytochrome c peroxidase
MRTPRKLFIAGLLGLATALALWLANGPLQGHVLATAFSAQLADSPDPATQAAFAASGCSGCHVIPGIPNAMGQVGPDLSNIGQDGAARVPGIDAEAYIRESILDPGAFIAPQCPNGNCPANVMPPNMGERLTAQELDLIIAHLLSLTGVVATNTLAYELVPIEIVRPAETILTPFAPPPKTYQDAQILLGKYLFFDPRLSGDANLSCATCHQPDKAFGDGQPLGAAYTGMGYFRNTPTLYNLVYNQGYTYWDGRHDAVDLPTTMRDHITEAHLMAMDGRLMVERVKQVPEYVQLFQDAYGRNPSFGNVLNALTAYVHSLNSPPAPYDRYLVGDAALSTDALAGLDLFEANCAACHSGPTFSDGEFYVSGVPENRDIWADPLRHMVFRRFFRQIGTPNYRNLTQDVGLYAVTKEADDWGAFRTAPLREVAHTAPYMHNGVFATLEEVVAFYDERLDLNLSATEVDQLVAFLNSLSSDELPLVEPTGQPNYQLRTLGENK